MSDGCPMHPSGGYGCPNCDRIYRSRSQKGTEIARLRADNARLREALEAIIAEGCSAHAPNDCASDCSSLAIEQLAVDGLSSSDASEWLRERERRVAERVREACAQSLRPKDGEQDRAVLTRIAFSQGAVRATDLDALLKEEET